MLQSFLLLPLSVIPVIIPVSSQIAQRVPSAYVQVAEVPLPQLSREQWEMLQQQQGTDRRPLRIHVTLSVYRGRVYGVGVLRGTGYPDIDITIVRWIAAKWKTASWFGIGTQQAVSLEIDPALRQVRFQTRAS
ncbi:MAG: hypothetical protein JO331_12280 [Verrucomicrobia bacterium]|nr:hypothetical protein [Verrucomicrobiota bacterium]